MPVRASYALGRGPPSPYRADVLPTGTTRKARFQEPPCLGSPSRVGCSMTDRRQEFLTSFFFSFLNRTCLVVNKFVALLSPKGCGPHSVSAFCIRLRTRPSYGREVVARRGWAGEVTLGCCRWEVWPTTGQTAGQGAVAPGPPPGIHVATLWSWQAGLCSAQAASQGLSVRLPIHVSLRGFQKA